MLDVQNLKCIKFKVNFINNSRKNKYMDNYMNHPKQNEMISKKKLFPQHHKKTHLFFLAFYFKNILFSQ